MTDGYVDIRGYRTWYRVVGEGDRTPLLCLHGGPGAPHDYLEPLEALASTGRKIVFYDQLGCGNSDRPHDRSLWTMGLFLDELAAVREQLGLERVHILGQSWGGMLALEHALSGAAGIKSLILANTMASIEDWLRAAEGLRSRLPSEAAEALARHEEAGDYAHPEYQGCMLQYYRRHVCRLDPWPEPMVRAFDKLGQDPEVYHTMWGPSEFTVTGNLLGWDVRPRLKEIQVPTLLISGEFDEATPEVMGVLHRGIVRSEWALLEGCSHLSHLENPAGFMGAVAGFLDRADGLDG